MKSSLSRRPFLVTLACTAMAALSYGGASKSASIARADSIIRTETPLTAKPALNASSEFLGRLPLAFERNDGQFDSQARFAARGDAYAVAIDAGGARLSLSDPEDPGHSTEVSIRFDGGRRARTVSGLELMPARSNYYRGTQANWVKDVPSFARVRATAVYDGIDVEYYGKDRELEYDFLVAPHADPAQIGMTFDGVDRIAVDGSGDLLLEVGGRTLRQHKPVAYQHTAAGRREVKAGYLVAGGRRAVIALGDYDRSQPLVIDPVLSYSSYFGGDQSDQVRAVAVDAAGNIYLTGVTRSAVFPVAHAHQPAKRGTTTTSDAFVTKLDPSGTVLLFSTFFGGLQNENEGTEQMGSIALDANGNVYIAGDTVSSDFPVTPGAFQATYAAAPGNPADGFIAKFSPAGTLLFSSFLGGTDTDYITGIGVAGNGDMVVVGRTRSASTEGFPLVAARDAVLGGPADAFVARINAAGSAIVYSTYVGGAGDELSFYDSGMALDAQGNVFFSGITTSTDYPTTAGTVRPVRNNATNEGFVSKLSADGQTLLASTYFGGSNGDNHVNDIALAPTGELVLTGQTESTAGFPVVNAFQSTFQGGSQDGFVAKLSADLTTIVFSTYFGGNDRDEAYEVAVDPQGTIHIVGETRSHVFPLVAPVQAQIGNPGTSGNDAFIAKLNANGTVAFSTYLGSGQVNESGLAVAATASGETIAGGWTAGTNFPRVNPYQNIHQGGFTDGWVARIGRAADLGLTMARSPASPAPGQQVAYIISVSNSGPEPATQVAVRDTFPASLSIVSCTANGGGSCTVAGNAITVTFAGLPLNNSATITVWTRVRPEVPGGTLVVNTAAVQGFSSDTNPANNSVTVNTLVTALVPGGDTDTDGLPNGWESDYGLDPLAGDAGADPDNDGRTNLEEYQQGTHPRGFVITYFAEGATGEFFDTVLAIANPGNVRALVLVRFQREDGVVIRHYRVVAPHSRATINVEDIAGLEAGSFSTLIEADVQVVADRTMSWDSSGYGGHTERGTLTRATSTWYLAEGATHGTFDLFYLIQNPGDTATTVEVRFLRPHGRQPIVKTYPVGPQTRFTLYVDQIPGLEEEEMSAVVRSLDNAPIVVERAMYLSTPTQPFAAGHNSAGVTSATTRWFLAEGATGPFFDFYMLIANPSAQAAEVDVEYLLADGQVVPKHYRLGPNSRTTLLVDAEDPRLQDAAVSTIITSSNNVPIVVERVMWWPSPAWHEAHNSPGETTTGSRWALAEGETGGARGKQTYILIANTSAAAGSARVTLLYEDGTTAQRTVTLPAKSRVNVPVDEQMFPGSSNRRFGALIESLGATPAQIVVERALYWNANGVVWAAGTNALGTKLQ